MKHAPPTAAQLAALRDAEQDPALALAIPAGLAAGLLLSLAGHFGWLAWLPW